MMVLMTFFGVDEQVSMVLALWELMLIWRMGVEIKSKIKCRITPGKWNDSRVSPQEWDFVYIMFYVNHFGYIAMV